MQCAIITDIMEGMTKKLVRCSRTRLTLWKWSDVRIANVTKLRNFTAKPYTIVPILRGVEMFRMIGFAVTEYRKKVQSDEQM